MKSTRRLFLMASSALIALIVRGNAKASSEGIKCTITLLTESKKPVEDFVVFLRSQQGTIIKGTTDKLGKFEFTALEDSSYTIQIRQPPLHTVVTAIRQMAAGELQSLSISIPSPNSYLGVYQTLQGIESMLVVEGGPEGAEGVDDKTLLTTLDSSSKLLDLQIDESISVIKRFKAGTVATDLLLKKAESLKGLLKKLGSS